MQYNLLFNFSGLVDEQQKVRTITALALAALAEAATPYGIESFDSVLKPLWRGIRQHRGKVNCKTYFWQILVLTPEMEGLSEEGQYWLAFVCWLRINLPR